MERMSKLTSLGSGVITDNQEGEAKSNPELLTRLLQQTGYLPDKSDYLAEGKTASSAC
jgi:hypothetical protein